MRRCASELELALQNAYHHLGFVDRIEIRSFGIVDRGNVGGFVIVNIQPANWDFSEFTFNGDLMSSETCDDGFSASLN